jgi:CheY-like chemotaxis protein
LENQKPILILVAEDDPDDRLLVREAFNESQLLCNLTFVGDGNELMDYLLRQGSFVNQPVPRPGLILLDLNMPGKDGREALAELKAHPVLRRIPVVVMTTSKAERDVLQSYELGVSSFLVKPVTFERLVEMVKTLGDYWLDMVVLPPDTA